MYKSDVVQGSREWHLLRHGRVGGTTLKSALGTPKVQKTLMHKVIAERMTEPQITDINSAAVRRGKEIEPLARKAVIARTGIDFIETGMLLDDGFEGFGISPDGIKEEGGVIVGGLEIKVPDSKKHVEYVVDNALPVEHQFQVMAPFLMNDCIKWWIFASFDDRNYEIPIFTHKVVREDFPNLEKDRIKLKAFLTLCADKHEEMTF